ncbi:MAG: hypothetical protein AAF563_03475 [Pseudomonadota bacterium]
MVSSFKLFESAAGADLIAAIKTVEDATAGDGPKFGPKTCRALNRMIVSRAYGKPLLELCFLLIIAARCDQRGGRYETLLWNPEPALPGVLHGLLRQAERTGCFAGGPVTLHHDAAEVATDTDVFRVAYSRMPVLTALAEFLLTALGYEAFDTHVAGLLHQPPRWRAVADVANALSRELNGYLQPRLESGHAQNRVKAMMDHLSERDEAAVQDETILSFWLAWSLRDDDAGEGFKTYRSVFRGFVRVDAALTAAREWSGVEHAVSIGEDREAGEVNPADVEDILTVVDAETSALDALTQPPLDAVKFLTQKELDALSNQVRVVRVMPDLRLSYLRDAVFGDHQLRITEAIRRRSDWDRTMKDDYAARIAAVRDLAGQIDLVVWAALHVLVEAEHAGVADLILALRPDIDLSGAMPAQQDLPDGVVAFPTADPVSQFLKLLRTNPDDIGGDVADIVATARKAHRRVNRRGFTADTQNESTLDAFQEAGPVLANLNKLAHHISVAFADTDHDTWSDQFDRDQGVFAAQFTAIYGSESHAAS